MPQAVRRSPSVIIANRLEAVSVLEQSHTQIMREVNVLAVARYAAIGNSHNQLALDYTLQIDVVSNFFGSRQDLASEFHFATT